MKVEVKVSGLDGVMDTLQKLPAEVASKRGGPVKLALARAARVIRDEARSNLRAVVGDSEETTGLLEKSVIASRGKAPLEGKGERYLVRVKRAAYDGKKLGKREGAGKRVTTHKTASLLEYGSSHQPATPWLRPAFVTAAPKALSVYETALKAGVDRAVKKLAKPSGGR